MGVGEAPSARQNVTWIFVGSERSLRPLMSSATRIGRLLFEMWRKPLSHQPTTLNPFSQRSASTVSPMRPSSAVYSVPVYGVLAGRGKPPATIFSALGGRVPQRAAAPRRAERDRGACCGEHELRSAPP